MSWYISYYHDSSVALLKMGTLCMHLKKRDLVEKHDFNFPAKA